MKSQVHNQGELKELKVNIESGVYDSIQQMATNANLSIDDIVVIALKGTAQVTRNLREKPQL